MMDSFGGKIARLWQAFRAGYEAGRASDAPFDLVQNLARCHVCGFYFDGLNEHVECAHCERRLIHNARTFGMTDRTLTRLTDRLTRLDHG